MLEQKFYNDDEDDDGTESEMPEMRPSVAETDNESTEGLPQLQADTLGSAEQVVNKGTGFIYFIEDPKGTYIKIGYSTKVLRRFEQIVAGQPGLRLLGFMPGTIETEYWIHSKFAANRQGDHEWFRATDELHDFIRNLGLLQPEAKDDVVYRLQPEPLKPLHIYLEVSLFKEIDDYRFANRFPKRAHAVKALLRIGLAQENKKKR
jgi:T5orf172 domain